MEQFETKFIINKDAYEEMRWLFLSTQDKFIILFCIVVAAAVSIGGILERRLEFVVFGILFAIIFLVAMFWNLRKSIKINLQRAQESTGSTDLEVLTSFTDDGIKTFNCLTNGTSTISYNDINKFAQTKSMYVLLTKSNQFMVVDKATLTEKGQSKEFVRFINSKLPHAKRNGAI